MKSFNSFLCKVGLFFCFFGLFLSFTVQAQVCNVGSDCSGCSTLGMSNNYTPPATYHENGWNYYNPNFNFVGVQNKISYLVGQGSCGEFCCNDEFSASIGKCGIATVAQGMLTSQGSSITDNNGSTINSPVYVWMQVNPNFVGRFQVTHKVINRSGIFGGGCGQSGSNEYTNRFCQLQTPGQSIGQVSVITSSSVVLANQYGEADVRFKWNNTTDYCSETLTQMKYIVIDSPDDLQNLNESAWTNITAGSVNEKIGLSHFATKYGFYTYRISVKDKWGHVYNFQDVTVEVVPSCTFDMEPLIYSDALDINGGYSSVQGQGGYLLNQNQTYTLKLNHYGFATDFCAHYRVVVDAGVTEPSTTIPASPTTGCVPDIQLEGSPLELTPIANPDNGTYSIKVNVPIGSFRIYPIKSSLVGDRCRNYNPIQIFVGGSNATAHRNCLVVLPRDMTILFPNVASQFGLSYALSHFVYTVSSSVGVIVEDGVILQDGAILKINVLTTTPGPELVDNNKNWTKAMDYDDNGNIISERKTFSDKRGRVTQSQFKNFQNKVIIATEMLYDAHGRPAIATLPAPVSGTYDRTEVNECGEFQNYGQDMYFLYKPNFVSTASANYSYLNFDDVTGNLKKNNPDPLGNTVPGTLGWYYSHNNKEDATVDMTKGEDRFIEPLVGKTSYPYSRSLYVEDGTNTVSGLTIPGDQFKAGSGHVPQSDTYPLSVNEAGTVLQHYYDVRNANVFPGSTVTFTQLKVNVYKSSMTDTEGKIINQYYTKDGKLIITHYTYAGDKWYNYYDQAGRLVCSISPNGVKQIIANPSSYATIAKTTYSYNHRGWLLETNEVDAGISKYMYRKDGKLKFKQNAVQAANGTFTYINYDKFGRIVEAGDFNPGTSALTFNSVALKAILESSAEDGDLVGAGSSKTEQTLTRYDLPDKDVNAPQNQLNTYGNVSYVEKPGVSKMWYSYDEQERVSWTIQRLLSLTPQQTAVLGDSKLEYRYNARGNVQEVAYKRGQSDQFYHVYEYDKNGNLSSVYTSKIAPTYEGSTPVLSPLTLQASYSYYLHGPMKRMEVANKLQGVDYVYTAQGWLKSINSHEKAKDPGKDANDLFGMTLNYFSGDYTYLDSKTGVIAPANIAGLNIDRFTGNISANLWFTQKPPSSPTPSTPEAFVYTYDGRNRSTGGVWGIIDIGENSYVTQGLRNHETGISYDGNSNIKNLDRYNDQGTLSHDFQYNYIGNTNKLGNVGGYNTSYAYDEIGQLQSVTNPSGTRYAKFNSSGLLTSMAQNADGTNPFVKSYYDQKGLRYKKETYDKISHNLVLTTFYVHDGAGNVMAVYDDSYQGTLQKTETPIYGASRIGQIHHQLATNDYYRYELKDHLGNVRVTFSRDAVIPTKANVESYADYYPYGMKMPSRNSDGSPSYRYGHQGQYAENDVETEYGHFERREYDPVIGRWMSADPARQYASPYVGMGANPANVVDPDGGYTYAGAYWRNLVFGNGYDLLYDKEMDDWGYKTASAGDISRGHYEVTVTNHWGTGKEWYNSIFSEGSNNGAHQDVYNPFKNFVQRHGIVSYRTGPGGKMILDDEEKRPEHLETIEVMEDPADIMSYPGSAAENIYDRAKDLMKAIEAGKKLWDEVTKDDKPQKARPVVEVSEDTDTMYINRVPHVWDGLRYMPLTPGQ